MHAEIKAILLLVHLCTVPPTTPPTCAYKMIQHYERPEQCLRSIEADQLEYQHDVLDHLPGWRIVGQPICHRMKDVKNIKEQIR